MEEAEFIARHPRLFHMAEDGSWPLIERLGLLSTHALVDAFGVKGIERSNILAARRPASVTITSPAYGQAVVRNQIPLREAVLERVLEDGLTPADWFQLLNSFVFFWPTEARLHKLLSARAYRDRAHTVLEVDTARLLAGHRESIRLSPINSGSTLFNARSRGRATFRRLHDYPYEEMRRRRGAAGAIAEVAVIEGVRPVQPVLLSVTRRQGTETLSELWSSSGVLEQPRHRELPVGIAVSRARGSAPSPARDLRRQRRLSTFTDP